MSPKHSQDPEIDLWIYPDGFMHFPTGIVHGYRHGWVEAIDG